MSYPTRKILWTIGGPESSAGTEAARTNVIPIRGTPGLTRVPTRTPDPAIIGSDMDVGDYLSADSIEGNLPISPRACFGFGAMLKSVLGTESTPAEVGACIRIRYAGSGASCKIMSVNADNDIHALTGAAGSETDNANWNSGGSISLAAAGFDTVAELVAAIEAYTDFECEKVFGADDCATNAKAITRTTQAKGKWAYIYFSSSTSDAYVRNYTADLTTTERPTYSIQGDGYSDQFLYTGCAVDSLSLSGALKGIIEGEATVLGFAETLSPAASAVTLEDVPPLFFWDGAFDLGGVDFPYISNISMRIDNQSNKDGYGQGGVGRIYHEKGIFAISGDMELKLDANTYARRADLFGANGAYCSMSFRCNGEAIGAASVDEMLLVELPFVQVTGFSFGETNGVFTAKMNWKAINPKGTVWDVPITATLISVDSAAY